MQSHRTHGTVWLKWVVAAALVLVMVGVVTRFGGATVTADQRAKGRLKAAPTASLKAAPTGNRVELPARDGLRNGDLIFRSGVSEDSRMVKLLDPGSPYSHVGLIDVRDGETYVIHVESGSTHEDELIRREPLAMFLEPGRANAFAVFHVVPADDRRGVEALDAALRYRSQGVSFDREFDLETAGTMYCTELIWRAYRDAGLDLLDGDFGRPSSFFQPLVRLTGLAHSRHVEPTEPDGTAP